MNVKLMTVTLLLPVSLSWLMGCILSEEEDRELYIIKSENYQYDLSSPEQRYPLPSSLEEVSGLAYWKDDLLLCIEDETGHLYVFDLGREEVIREIKFGKKGDYEGLTQSNDTAYVIRSDGRMYCFKIEDDPEVIKIKLPFKKKNNIEGIAWVPHNNEFYLALKGSPDLYDRDLKGRAVYRYDMKNDTVFQAPILHLKTDPFREKLKEEGLIPSIHMPFGPSGISVHPHSKDLFMISSVGRLLITFNSSGDINAMSPLRRQMLRQPEGICFDSDGNMYIANEGRGGKGYIVRFKNALPDR